jgi:hypothetical protein
VLIEHRHTHDGDLARLNRRHQHSIAIANEGNQSLGLCLGFGLGSSFSISFGLGSSVSISFRLGSRFSISFGLGSHVSISFRLCFGIGFRLGSSFSISLRLGSRFRISFRLCFSVGFRLCLGIRFGLCCFSVGFLLCGGSFSFRNCSGSLCLGLGVCLGGSFGIGKRLCSRLLSIRFRLGHCFGLGGLVGFRLGSIGVGFRLRLGRRIVVGAADVGLGRRHSLQRRRTIRTASCAPERATHCHCFTGETGKHSTTTGAFRRFGHAVSLRGGGRGHSVGAVNNGLRHRGHALLRHIAYVDCVGLHRRATLAKRQALFGRATHRARMTHHRTAELAARACSAHIRRVGRDAQRRFVRDRSRYRSRSHRVARCRQADLLRLGTLERRAELGFERGDVCKHVAAAGRASKLARLGGR